MSLFRSYSLNLIVFLTLLAGFGGCSGWNLPERDDFPDCSSPKASLEHKANELQVEMALTPIEGDIREVEWDFGDNTVPLTTKDFKASHAYVVPGTYTVKAILRNPCNETTPCLKRLSVSDVTLPIITTLPVSDTTETTATLNLKLISRSKGIITRSGVCYSSTDSIPEITDKDVEFDTTRNPAGEGVVNPIAVRNLKPNTSYYVRAFAYNQAGAGYGNTVKFRTWGKAAVTTETAFNTLKTSTSIFMRIDSVGNPEAKRYGICYLPDQLKRDPTVKDLTQETNFRNVGSSITVPLSNLRPNTRYRYRAYAVNEAGESYGIVKTFQTASDIDADRGLIAYYPANGSPNDDNTNQLHGVLRNGATYTTDRHGNPSLAFLFDGVNDYFEIPDTTLLRPKNLSISFWVKFSSRGNRTRQQLFAKSRWEDGMAEQYSAHSKAGSGQNIAYSFEIKQNSKCKAGEGQQLVTGNDASPGNKWYHLVYTYEGKFLRIYVNGELISVNTDLPLPNVIDDCPGGTLRFAAQTQEAPDYFEGAMDDIRIYNRALPEAEIKALSNQ